MKRKASFAAFGLALVLAGCSKAVTEIGRAHV